MLGIEFAPNQVMRIALPIWLGRISPGADEATELLLVDVCDGAETGRETRRIDEYSLPRRADAFSRLQVDQLICGEISQVLQQSLEAQGVRVQANIYGKADRVLGAFMAGRLDGPRSACRGGRPTVLPPQDHVSGDGASPPRRGQVPDARHRKRGAS